MTTSDKPDPTAVNDRVQELREEDLLDFIRETVQNLAALSDRLESYVIDKENLGARDTRTD